MLRAPAKGWEALAQWGAVRIEPLAGGVANDVWSVRTGRELAVARLGTRSDAALAWEAALLQHPDRAGADPDLGRPVVRRSGRHGRGSPGVRPVLSMAIPPIPAIYA
ncbi:hypothetical protein ASD04_01490 [Devosia sp. Root436]|nr:hypothetical protein ASD04_01490 [Devosia sp. Root436]